MEVKTLDQLQKVFDEYLLLGDRNLIRLLCAVVIANQLDHVDPVWILLVASPASGKSETLQAFNDIIDPVTRKPMIYPISDLTINSFASGQTKTGQETSLLHKMPRGGIMVFKDFTSLLSKNEQAQQEIVAQLREIYDGAYIKRTGTGKDITWNGKIGALAGCTEVVYEHMEKLSAMGDRFAMYSIMQPDRKEVLKFSIANKRKGENKELLRAKSKGAAKMYVEYILKNKTKFNISISPETEDELITLADFCTKVRSGVIVDKRFNRVEFVPSAEMPMRLIDQLFALLYALMLIRRVEAGETGSNINNIPHPDDLQIVYKIAYDSIPIKRRMALKLLAKYGKGARTAGLATAIGYETKVVGNWLSQLNGLGICRREKKMGPQGDSWMLSDEGITVMQRFQGIKTVDAELTDDKATDEDTENWEKISQEGVSETKAIDDSWADGFTNLTTDEPK